jgi:succinate dehydrogenase / fumarate reductase, cytochrome b subunit
MDRNRDVSVIQGLRYQGGAPQLAYVLHRISGLGIVIFVTIHILASFLGGDIGQFFNDVYVSWWFQIIVIFCALFHGINGLRITILDLWPKLLEHQREAIWLEWFVFLPIFGLAVIVIVRNALGG